MVRCEYKFALGFWALCFFAAVNAFAVPIEPFYFENAVDQEATWDDLMKYKLWGTGLGGEGVVFSNNKVFINDSNGYSGSASGGLSFTNEAHSLGGPLAFGGGFSTGTGGDSILNGPSHFGGRVSLTFNSSSPGKVTWNGPICSDVDGFDFSCCNAATHFQVSREHPIQGAVCQPDIGIIHAAAFDRTCEYRRAAVRFLCKPAV